MSTETKQKNPHLFCLITGKSRPTTWAYLNDKAERLGVDADTLINNYVSREAITRLLDGKSIAEIRESYSNAPDTVISDERLAELVRMNSKAKKAAEKFNVVATIEEVAATEEQPMVEEVVAEEKPKKSKKKKKKDVEAPTDEQMVETVVEDTI